MNEDGRVLIKQNVFFSSALQLDFCFKMLCSAFKFAFTLSLDRLLELEEGEQEIATSKHFIILTGIADITPSTVSRLALTYCFFFFENYIRNKIV